MPFVERLIISFLIIHYQKFHCTMKKGSMGSASLASQPLHKKGRVWYGAVTRVVLFPRNPGEHEYANFAAAA